MKKAISAIAFLCLASSVCFAQDPGYTTADYLMITNAQQEIYLQRILNGNTTTYGVCVEGMSIEQVNHAFTDWVKNKPNYLQRPLFPTFTAALIDFCAAKNITVR